MNPVHTRSSYILKIYFNIIHLSLPRGFSGPFPSWFPRQSAWIYFKLYAFRGRDCVVGVATCYGLEGIESLWWLDFLYPSKPALWPTHPCIQWVPGLFLRDRAAGAWPWQHTPSSVSCPSRPVIRWNSPLPISSYPTRVTCSAHIILNLIIRIIYNNTQVIELIIQIYPVYSLFLPLRPNYLLLHSILEHPQLLFFPSNVRHQVLHPYKTPGTIIVCLFSSCS